VTAGISFMGRAWDHDKGGRDAWIAWMQTVAAEALRVCKPGAHALVWALPRTSHWTAMAWENAGWVVRDRLAHLFGSGFPKSLDVSKAIDREAGAEREVIGFDQAKLARNPNGKTGSMRLDGFTSILQLEEAAEIGGKCPNGRDAVTTLNRLRKNVGNESAFTAPATDAAKQWEGWHTALKPACEDWWLLRKPLSEPTVAANVLKHGTGVINIDKCRVGTEVRTELAEVPNMRHADRGENGATNDGRDADNWDRYKAETGRSARTYVGRWPANVVLSDDPEVMDAFAKAGERPSGCTTPSNAKPKSIYRPNQGNYQSQGVVYPGDTGTAARFFFTAKAASWERTSDHPTVKPQALMKWLLTLVTPSGGRVLDPFCGTGSTLCAADWLGIEAVGIEQDAKTCADAETKIRRLRARRMLGNDAKSEAPVPGQMSLGLE